MTNISGKSDELVNDRERMDKHSRILVGLKPYIVVTLQNHKCCWLFFVHAFMVFIYVKRFMLFITGKYP